VNPLRELRRAGRALLRRPGLTLAAVTTLGLGIALTASMFSVVDGALQDLPFEDSERLVLLQRRHLEGRQIPPWVSPGDFLDWREHQTSFEDLAAFRTTPANLSSSGMPPERRQAARVTPGSFTLLRVRPLLGRDFLATDADPGADRVVILSHGLWRDRFGQDRRVLGRTLRINGESAAVVGVMPEAFRFPLREDLWLPLRLDSARVDTTASLQVLGRLREGVSLERAAREVDTLAARQAAAHPATHRDLGVEVEPYTEAFVPQQIRSLLRTMQAAVFGVLLIACANVANLLLARTLGLRRETAVHLALGAGRWRLVGQRLTETLLLAAAGGVLGLLATVGAVRLLDRIVVATEPPFWVRFRVDSTVLLFIAGVTVLVTVAAGLLPALRSSGTRAEEVLRSESDGGRRGLGRLSELLVVAEVAVTCGLLATAGVMVQTVVNLRSLDLGFDPGEYLTARLEVVEGDYPDPAARHRLFESFRERVEALPGVRGAALVSTLPATVARRSVIAIEGQGVTEPEELPITRLATVTAGFFETLDLGAFEGRTFRPADDRQSRAVAVVNRAFARRFFPGESPVGRRVLPGGSGPGRAWRTILGVVPDLYLAGPGATQEPGVYIPLSQGDAFLVHLVARTQGEPLALAASVRRELQALDRHQPLAFVGSLRQAISRRIWFYDVFGGFFVVFGTAALVLAAVGLYGVVAFSVARRTREVGVRMALGALPSEVLRLVVRRGGAQLAAGLALGLGLAVVLARAIGFILVRVDPWDPATLGLTVALLAGVGFTACLIPGGRALRIDPATALRQE